MKIYARTPNGTGFVLTVILTGQVQESQGDILCVEVILPIGCDRVVARIDGGRIDYSVEKLPMSPMGQQLLWAVPGDICADDGGRVDQDQLRAEVVRVNDQRRLDMARGPLGENWP